jgi:hypothetical protein
MRRLDGSFKDFWEICNLLGRFPCSSDREGSQLEILGYGFFHETRREVSVDLQD